MMQRIKDMFLRAPTERQKKLISNLRNQAHAAHIEYDSSIEKKWTNNLIEVRENILRNDPRNFLRWNVIKYTMFHNCKPVELAELRKDARWPIFEKAIKNNSIGNPQRYKHFGESDGNTIHQGYNLQMFLKNTGLDLSKMTTLFEFGGGYGCMAKMAYSLGFTGTYIIFDLPIFSALQEYFLASSFPEMNISRTPVRHRDKQIVLISDLESLQQQLAHTPPQAFLAMWSLSESPVKLRQLIEKCIEHVPYVHIAYQAWFGRDNNAYFKELEQRKNDYSWTTEPMTHAKGNYYLTGVKKIKS